jgi:hypothetical protein
MGNVLNIPAEGDPNELEKNDQMYLDLATSSLFNDKYVNQTYPRLPKFEGTETDKKNASSSNSSDAESLGNARLHRLMDLFRPENKILKQKKTSSIEEIPVRLTYFINIFNLI